MVERKTYDFVMLTRKSTVREAGQEPGYDVEAQHEQTNTRNARITESNELNKKSFHRRMIC